ncbi:MAG TPA: hypothetical protein VGF86_11235 [Candidatus Tumulicola sp.]
MKARTALTMLAAALLCACGGGSNTPDGPVVNSPGSGGRQPGLPLVDVALTVTIPPQPHHGIRPNYVSPNTRSIAIGLVSVDGNGISGVPNAIVETGASARNCHRADGGITCTATISGSPGSDSFAVSTYDGTSATGAVLSIGTVSSHVGGSGKVAVDAMSLDIGGIIASLELSVSPKIVPRGKPADAAVTLQALDASGATVVGGSDFASPVTLDIEGDVVHAFSLIDGHHRASSLTLAKPPGAITLGYDGDRQAGSVTLQASVAGPQSPTANTPFALKGRQPPPPVGTIYVLNLGANDGKGATVTAYDGSADGNAAPLRDLQLDAKRFARSIAVDAQGRLYVGYFDSALGFSPGTGQPDKGNEVAVYAAGAGGNDAPGATISADSKTKSTLYPTAMAFDPGGNLLTYGATTIDGNNGDAVLTYASDGSGSSVPLDAFDFSSPVVNYAGPVGLALDAGGNVYLSGALKAPLGQNYGVFVASAADIGNPSANVARTIPWDANTQLAPGLANVVSLDSAGEIFVSNQQREGSGSATSCQGRANVFASGATGGVTDVPPLRVLVLDGVYTADPTCSSSRNPLQANFPAIAVYGETLFAADDFNDAVAAYATSKGGIVEPSMRLSGPATLLDAPIAVAVSLLSGSAQAGPATGARAPAPSLAHPVHLHRTSQGPIKD